MRSWNYHSFTVEGSLPLAEAEAVYLLITSPIIESLEMGVTPTVLGYDDHFGSTTGAVGFSDRSSDGFHKIGTSDASTIYFNFILKGDVIEMKVDRSVGAFSA